MDENHGTVGDEIRAAVERRHWPVETVAQATSLPTDKVEKHLTGQECPTTQEVERYAGALGLSDQQLLAKAAIEGPARTEKTPSLLAIQQLLGEAWEFTTPEERGRIFESVQELHDRVVERRRQPAS